MAADIAAKRTSPRTPTQEELDDLLATLGGLTINAGLRRIDIGLAPSDRLLAGAQAEAYEKVYIALAELLGYEMKGGSNG